MNTSDFEKLKNLGLPIVVPRSVPAGFVLKQVTPMADENGDGYSIEWHSPEGTLRLFGVSGGIGDRLPGDKTLEFQHPTFGLVNIEVEESQLATGWMSEMSNGLPAYSLVAQSLNEEQFLQTARSLDYVKL